jgi:hypothetical protein
MAGSRPIRIKPVTAMLAARTSSSESGDGNHRWLRQLIGKIGRLTRDLEKLTALIRRRPDPTVEDLEAANDLVIQLVTLIDAQIRPHRMRLSQMATASSSIRKLDQAVASLDQSGQEALRAIYVYLKALNREHQQEMNERRSIPRLSADQQALQQLRTDAATKVRELVTAAEGFVRIISS